MNPTVQELVAALTLEEKAGLCSGADFWHTKQWNGWASRPSRSVTAPTACAPSGRAAPTQRQHRAVSLPGRVCGSRTP